MIAEIDDLDLDGQDLSKESDRDPRKHQQQADPSGEEKDDEDKFDITQVVASSHELDRLGEALPKSETKE